MKEGLQYPQGRIARIVEREAGKKFGPETLTKDLVASALNVPIEQLSEVEWEEISEFAVNAGAALIRSSLEKEETGITTMEELESVRDKIKQIRDGMIPYHDIFHAAETYRLTNGASASAEFTETQKRERYVSPIVAAAELYPTLFLVSPPHLNQPVPVLLTSTDGRMRVARFLLTTLNTDLPEVSHAVDYFLTSEPPVEPPARKQEYEQLLELILTSNAKHRLKEMAPLEQPLTEEEITNIHQALEKEAEYESSHYGQFAQKVFADDWSKDPRLFLDEFLSCIRTEGAGIVLSSQDIE